MKSDKYDPKSVDEILVYARRLIGKSLADVASLPEAIISSRNKGDLGSLVEEFFFGISPGRFSGPDFHEAGLELKTTGVVRGRHGKFRAKERLVLTMINYRKIVGEAFESSTFLTKCGLMLILFYLYERDVPAHRRRFVLEPFLYSIPPEDLPTIRSDWETIRQKVASGLAHELSEGDTFFLGACRKGSGGPNEPLHEQPFSHVAAKSRAFSFKASYLNRLLEDLDEPASPSERGPDQSSGEVKPTRSPAMLLQGATEMTVEEASENKFAAYAGIGVDEISNSLNFHRAGPNHKGFYRELAVRMLDGEGRTPPEIEKAGIEMKTVRLLKSGRPREHMSFPGFRFMEIIDEEWEESVFFERLERKFLFVVFAEEDDGNEVFRGAKFWNMPYSDRLEAERVWEETKRRVQIDATDLPTASESEIAHVRPKARDGRDKAPTPQGGMHVKQAFWLNANYISKVLEVLFS